MSKRLALLIMATAIAPLVEVLHAHWSQLRAIARWLLPALCVCASANAATQITIQAENISLASPWTYSTDSDSPEGAWVVPLDSQASISATISLGQVLAPGNYSVYVKVLGYDFYPSNLVTLDGVTGALNVNNDRGERDLPDYWSTNVTVHTANAASNLIVSFYRGSSAHSARWFTTYVTSDTNEIVLKNDLAISFLYPPAVVDTAVTPGNKVFNSSFEGGVSRNWRLLYSVGHVPTFTRTYTLQDCLETNNGFHGLQSLRLATDTNSTIFYVQSNPITCASNRLFSLSCYAKSSAGNNRATLRVSSIYTAPSGYTTTFSTNTTTTVGTSWTRVSLSNIWVPWYPNGQVFLTLETRQDAMTGGGTYTYFDAVQFEEGPLTAYAPMSSFEAGSTLSERTQVVWTNDAPTLLLRGFNNGSSSVTKQVVYALYNWTNGLVWSGTTNLTAAASNFASATLTPPVNKKGHFRLVTSITNQAGSDELTWLVVAPPATTNLDAASYFGGHMNADSNVLARAQRVGVKTTRFLSLGPRGRWDGAEPTNDVFVYPSTADVLLYTNYGITPMMNIGENVPSWISPATDATNYFRDFVSNIVTHFSGSISNYEIWNEPNQDQTEVPNLNHYTELLRIAATTIKAIDPNITVTGGGGLSTVQMITNVWALLGSNTNKVDAMSVHLYPPNERSAADIRSYFNAVPVINSETGITDKGGYTFGNYPAFTAGHYVTGWKNSDAAYDTLFGNAEAQSENLLTCLAYGLRQYYYYDAGQRQIEVNDTTSIQWTWMDYDDSLRAKAGVMAGIFSLLDKCTGQGALNFSNQTALAYTRGSTPLVAVWSPTNMLAVLAGSITASDIRVYDVMGNVSAPATLALPFGRMPIIIEGQGATTLSNLCHAFSNAVVTARADLTAPTLVLAQQPVGRGTVRWFALDESVPSETTPNAIQYRYRIDGSILSGWADVTSVDYLGDSVPTLFIQARDAAGNISTISTEASGATNIAKLKGRIRVTGDVKVK